MTLDFCKTGGGLTITLRTWAVPALAAALIAIGWTWPAQAGAGPAHSHDHVQTAETKKNLEEKPEITIGSIPVAGKITMLIGVGGFTGGNVAVLPGPDGLLIVDDKLTGFGEKLEKALQAAGLPAEWKKWEWPFIT